MHVKNLLALAFAASAGLTFTACSDDPEDTNKPVDCAVTPSAPACKPEVDCTVTPTAPECQTPPGDDCPAAGSVLEVKGSITNDQTWCASATYVIAALTYIEGGATVTIEPGTLIQGKKGAALVVTADGTLVSEGTASKPIVFTSQKAAGQAEAGDWGGIVMLGRAKINVSGGSNQIEGIDPSENRAQYGGTDDTHNCGTVAYTRIEYAGDVFGQDNELNGLTLGGCGNTTSLHHIQVIDGLDDGIEFFGGNADLTYAIVTNPGDDGVDWDEGYRGRMQFIVVEMETPNSDDPRAFEWDGLKADHNATPLAHVVLANATIYQTGTQAGVAGAKIRRGAGADLYNVLLAGFSAEYLDVESTESVARTTLAGIGFFGRGTNVADYLKSTSTVTPSQIAVAGATIDIPYPAAGGPATANAVDGPTDAWFVTAEYLGAFDPAVAVGSQWNAGWSR